MTGYDKGLQDGARVQAILPSLQHQQQVDLCNIFIDLQPQYNTTDECFDYYQGFLWQVAE